MIEKFVRVNQTDFSGNNLMESFKVESMEDCENACALNDLCFTYTYKNFQCWLKFRYRYQHTALKDASALSGYPYVGKSHCNLCISYDELIIEVLFETKTSEILHEQDRS